MTNKRENIVTDNTLKKHFQEILADENFINEVSNWLDEWGDKRLLILRRLIFEIDLSETEKMKETLCEYGSCLTETNYGGRSLFSRIAALIGQLEENQYIEA